MVAGRGPVPYAPAALPQCELTLHLEGVDAAGNFDRHHNNVITSDRDLAAFQEMGSKMTEAEH
jgi:hypothetical protein